jgi:hypothetical protein
MLAQIAIASALMLATTFVHSGCTVAALWVLRMAHAGDWGLQSPWTKVSLVAGLVWAMFIAAVLEIGLWAALYLGVGAISGPERAAYFSTVTFTTLGYGDITLDESWRLLASFEAANGVLLFGWSTALIYAFVRRIAAHNEAGARKSRS